MDAAPQPATPLKFRAGGDDTVFTLYSRLYDRPRVVNGLGAGAVARRVTWTASSAVPRSARRRPSVSRGRRRWAAARRTALTPPRRAASAPARRARRATAPGTRRPCSPSCPPASKHSVLILPLAAKQSSKALQLEYGNTHTHTHTRAHV